MDNRLTTVTIKGKAIAVYVDSSGRFYCNIEHDSKKEQAPYLGDGDPNVVEAKTLDELKTKALKLLGRKKIEIEVWEYNEDRDYRQDNKRIPKWKHGFVTGKHSSNRNLLVRWDGHTSSEQAHSWSHGPMILSEAERDSYMELKKLYDKTGEELNKLKSKGKERIDAAIAKAIGSEE